MEAKYIKEATSERVDRLIQQFSSLSEDVETCKKRLSKRNSKMEEAQCLLSTLNGMEQRVDFLRREIHEQLVVLRTLYDLNLYEETND